LDSPRNTAYGPLKLPLVDDCLLWEV
jgi:hypothetical protein